MPESVAVFARHGIDSCCGGALSLREAAARHGLTAESLLAELRAGDDAEEGVAEAAGSCGCGCGGHTTRLTAAREPRAGDDPWIGSRKPF